ncbi:MAG: HpcH/HpaI aldolase/citrate lyase family protein [Thermodesulfobacteriota bacterium]|nr:HpcH/HpaI aldolase/citrate lyase family protein [Thermodesulfobacteriota bacterium]
MKNPLKETLRTGKAAIGTFVQIGHPDVTEMLSHAGFDWLLLDGEHGPFGIETMQVMLQAMSATKTVPIIRVPWNDPVYIKRALDIGAYGLLIPLVSSKREAENVIHALRYPPVGIRGVGPRRASRYYLDFKEYVATVDSELLTMVQIETKEAVENISEILSVDGIDAYFVGPMDLSAALGHIGDTNHPEVAETIAKIVAAGKKAKKIGGIYAFSIDDIKNRIEQGFQLISFGSDSRLMMGSAQEALKKIKEIIK